MEFLDLFLVALMPVLKVMLITALGLFLAIDQIDLLGSDARHHLNNLVFYVFSPAIISSSLANAITFESLDTLWFMPVNILLTFIFGSALGWILVKITRTPQHLRGLVISCCSAGNVGNLLLIILPSLCEEQNSPFGDSTSCSSYAEAYASLSMAILAIFLWTYIYNILRISASNEIEENGTTESTIRRKSPRGNSGMFAEDITEVLLPQDLEEHSDQTESSHARPEGRVKFPALEIIKQRFKGFSERIHLKKILAPSTIAAIVGLSIGVISPIRKLMIGDSAPLRVIYSATSFLGEAAIPCITLIVGGNLLKGLKRGGVSPLVLVGIIIVKYLLLPPLGVLVVKAGQHFGIIGSNSFYHFTLLLQYAVPPAMNIGTITQLVQTGQTECSVIMLWTYVSAALFLTLWSAYFMWLVA